MGIGIAAAGQDGVLEDLDGIIDLVLDGGPTSDRVASTVLDLTQQPARLLREGKITRAELEPYLFLGEA